MDRDNARQSRYYDRSKSKKVRIAMVMDFSVADDLRAYAESSGLTQRAVIEAAVSGYLSGGYYV